MYIVYIIILNIYKINNNSIMNTVKNLYNDDIQGTSQRKPKSINYSHNNQSFNNFIPENYAYLSGM